MGGGEAQSSGLKTDKNGHWVYLKIFSNVMYVSKGNVNLISINIKNPNFGRLNKRLKD